MNESQPYKSIDSEVFLQTQKRFICFLDILGFSQMVRDTENLLEFSKKYQEIFENSEVQSFRKDLRIELRVFSDSLVFGVCKEKMPTDLELLNIVNFSSQLLTISILKRFPIRGAIAYGEMVWADEVVVGRPIVEAAETEKVQEWIGIALCPSVTQELFFNPKLNKKITKLVVDYEVPVKEGKFVKGRAVLPRLGGYSTDQLQQALMEQCIASFSPDVQRKYSNTLKFLELSCTSIPS